MKDKDKTKDQLINELMELRQKITELEASEIECKRAAEALKKSEERYRLHFENVSDVIYSLDHKLRVIRISPSVERLLGYKPEELIGKPFQDLNILASEYLETAFLESKRVLAGERIDSSEYEFIAKDGTKKIGEVSSAPLSNDGKVIAIISVARDITDRRRSEKELRSTKNYLDNIIESSLDCIIVSDNTGHVTRVNNAFIKLLGYKKEEIVGKHIAVLSPTKEGTYESTIGESIQINEQFFNDTKTMVSKLVKEGKVFNLESYLIRKDKKLVPVESNSVYLYNEKGDKIGAVGIVRDITERKKAEKEIKESKEFLENIIESSRDGIVITDDKGHILSYNNALQKIGGFSKEELIGEHISTLIAEEDEDNRKRFLEKSVEMFEKGFTSFEWTLKTKDNKIVDVECNSSLVKDDKGNYIAGVNIIRDISKRKKMEQQLLQSEKLKSLGELAGGVAHDFNNVLAVILGRAQLLKMGIEPPPGKQERRKSLHDLKKGLEIMECAARDGAETVRRIQEFSRRRADDKEFTQVDINELIDHALEFTKARWKDEAESKGIKINIQKELSSLPPTTGSASEIREVFTNLINNALDAMPQGGEIKIRTFKDKEDSHISIKVEDTGIGIPKAIRDRIFDPFFTTKGVQSTGLGMSVSYGIINRHRGTISVDSIEGQGTTFTIKLPIFEKAIEAEKIKSMPKEQKKARILIIEDEEQVRALLSTILITDGHEVETATDGINGIEKFEKKKFDLVFTDLGMPGMSGWQVAEKIKSIDGRVPVALITGWDIKLKESEVREKWVDLIIQKPFEVNQVLRLVQEGIILRDRFKTV